MRQFAIIVFFTAFAACATQAFGITLGQSDDFNDTTLQGWASGAPNPVPPVNVQDAGQLGIGDHVLHVQSTSAFSGAGSLPTVFNSAQWTGDYLAAGVNAITFDVNNLSNVAINPGFEVQGAGGSVFTLSLITVPANSGWQTITISLAPGNLAPPPGVLATLGNVTELRLRNIAGGTVIIPADATTAYYDNITAVPEPASLALLGLSACALIRRRLSVGHIS